MTWGSVYLQSDYYDMESTGNKICRGNNLGDVLKELKGGMKSRCDGVVTGMSKSLKACKRFARNRNYDGPMTINDVPAVLFINKQQFHEENPTAVEVDYEEEWLKENPDIVEALMTTCPDNRPMDDKISSAMSHWDEFEVVVKSKQSVIPKYYPNINIYTEVDHLRRMGIEVSSYPTLKNSIPVMEKFTEEVKKKLIDEEVGNIIEGHMNVGIFLCQHTMNLMDDGDSKCALFDKLYVEGKE